MDTFVKKIKVWTKLPKWRASSPPSLSPAWLLPQMYSFPVTQQNGTGNSGFKRFFEECKTAPFGMEDGRIRDYQISASSVFESFTPRSGRLNNRIKSWCPAKYRSLGEWLQIDFREKMAITRVATQGRHNQHSGWVKSYKLSSSEEKDKWHVFKVNGQEKVRRDAKSYVHTRIIHINACIHPPIHPTTYLPSIYPSIVSTPCVENPVSFPGYLHPFSSPCLSFFLSFLFCFRKLSTYYYYVTRSLPQRV